MLPKPLSLALKSSFPVWVDQWPLPIEKLTALIDLVQQQLQQGHIEPSTSPYNTPIFVIKKKSGKWRLLQDLRKINDILQPMGPLQCGLPNPNLIPQNYDLVVIDLKDCFFSIPLAEPDRLLFAFTIPEFNNSRPTKRYQWKVLPQGMLNSPTMCQDYVDKVLEPFRHKYPKILVYHYMDDILIAAEGPKGTVMQTIPFLTQLLNSAGLFIAPDKIQSQYPVQYLGHKVLAAAAAPDLPLLNIGPVTTLVKLQQYLGTLNWARPYFSLPTNVLSPLFKALIGPKHPADKIILDSHQLQVVQEVNLALRTLWVDRLEANIPISLAVLSTPQLYTGILMQISSSKKLLILEWLHLSHTPKTSIFSRITQLAALFTKARKRAKAMMGLEIDTIYLPFRLTQWEEMFVNSDVLQIALENWNGKLSCHLPTDPRLQLIKTIPTTIFNPIAKQPIPQALTVFTDGSKAIGACVWQLESTWHKRLTTGQSSAQQAELAAFNLALSIFQNQPLNIITDSLYVANIVFSIFDAYISPSLSSSLMTLFSQLQQLLQKRTTPLFVAHIRSHQHLPGFLSEGNHMADEACKSVLQICALTAGESHSYFHQNKKALVKQFGLTHQEAAAIIQQCPTCSLQARSIPEGVNPRGTQACETWQMDVTQFPPFAPWKYIHVSVDTYSGFIMATLQRGETAKQTINHCIRSFITLGCPKILKTDNGPAYTSTAFSEFCYQWDIVHKFGIPFNSQGQAIVERTHQTLKNALQRYLGAKGASPPTLPVLQNVLNVCLYTLNFLNLTGSPATSAASRHFSNPPCPTSRPSVYYRQLPDPAWKGPVPLITWGKGYAAVQLPDRTLWVPARCVRPYHAITKPSPAADFLSLPLLFSDSSIEG